MIIKPIKICSILPGLNYGTCHLLDQGNKVFSIFYDSWVDHWDKVHTELATISDDIL